MNIHDQDIYFKAKNEGEYQAKVETAKNMLKNNISLEIIVECTGIPLQTVEELAKNLKKT